MFKRILMAIVLSCVVGGAVNAQSPMAATLVGGSVPNVVVPNALVFVTGPPWILPGLPGATDILGTPVLLGYSVFLDGEQCLLTHVSDQGIVFLVNASAKPGKRVLQVMGLISQSLEVQVDPYAPILVKQVPPGEENPECCVVAMGFPTFAPRLYIGEPIPTDYGAYIYIQVSARGMGAGSASQNTFLRPIVALQRGFEVQRVLGEAFASPGFLGAERVGFTPPNCLNGNYRMRLEQGGKVSEWVAVRFAATCEPPVSIKRWGLTR